LRDELVHAAEQLHQRIAHLDRVDPDRAERLADRLKLDIDHLIFAGNPHEGFEQPFADLLHLLKRGEHRTGHLVADRREHRVELVLDLVAGHALEADLPDLDLEGVDEGLSPVKADHLGRGEDAVAHRADDLHEQAGDRVR
jgi:hypothetical protein